MKKLQGKDALAAAVDSDGDDGLPSMLMQPNSRMSLPLLFFFFFHTPLTESRKNDKKKEKKKEKKRKPKADPVPEPKPKVDSEPEEEWSAPAAAPAPKQKKKKAKAAAKVESDDSEDIDAILNAHTKATNSTKAKPTTTTTTSNNSYHSAFQTDWTKDTLSNIVKADPKHFNAEEELKRIFGSAAINQERRENNDNRRRPNPRHQTRGTRGAARTLPTRFKECPLVQADAETWPRYSNPGYTGKLDPFSNECTITENADCIQADKLLRTVIDSMQIQALQTLLHKQPYHISSLLAASEAATQMGQFPEAAILVDQAVYSAWMSLPADFKLSDAFTVRTLPYNVKGNAPMFTAFWIKIQSMVRRGCMRTALEWAKMLFNLDEKDPQHAVLLLDYTAIKAGQWRWLLDFQDLLSKTTTFKNVPGKKYLSGIATLPSMLYGKALASKLMLNAGGSDISSTSPEAVKCEGLLMDAIKKYPNVVPGIMQKVKGMAEPYAAEVLSVLSGEPSNPRVAAVCELYVERSAELWSGPMIAWMVSVAHKLSATDLAPLPASEADSSEIFARYSTCTTAHLMGKVDVLPEEALAEGDGGGDGFADEDFGAAEEGMGGGDDYGSEAMQMLSLADMEITSLEKEVNEWVVTQNAADKVRLNEMVCVFFTEFLR